MKTKREDELPLWIVIDDGVEILEHHIETESDVEVTEDIVEVNNWRIIEYIYHDEVLDRELGRDIDYDNDYEEDDDEDY